MPSREVIWALEQGAAAVGAVSHSKGVQAREAIDAFIMGLVRFQVGCCVRFNDMQHTSPGTLKVTSSTVEMMAWQTKSASAFRIKKNPVPLIAPKLSLSGADWWTDWVETLKSLFALERFQDMDYLDGRCWLYLLGLLITYVISRMLKLAWLNLAEHLGHLVSPTS